MKMSMPALLIATSLAAAPPALAEEPPRPTVDFQGEWQVEDASQGQIASMLMRYSVDEPVMYMEFSQDGIAGSAVRYIDTGEMIMWTNQMPGMAMRMTVPEDDFLSDAVNTGESRQIGEESCVVWTVEAARVCVTEDGIPIENEFDGGIARIVNLERGEQDGSSFGPPAGTQIMDMPQGMPQGGPMPGAGMGLPF